MISDDQLYRVPVLIVSSIVEAGTSWVGTREKLLPVGEILRGFVDNIHVSGGLEELL